MSHSTHVNTEKIAQEIAKMYFSFSNSAVLINLRNNEIKVVHFHYGDTCNVYYLILS